MSPVAKDNVSVERVIIALPGLVILAGLVGFTLHSWTVLFASFGILIIATMLSRIRFLSATVFLVSMGIVSWGFGSAFYRNFDIQRSVFHSAYILCVGIFFSVILLSLFGYILGAVFIRSRKWVESTNIHNQDPLRKAFEEQEFTKIEPPQENAFDPYAVLGVQQGATHDDIRSAYRKQMQLYHPDRVEHLGSELKRTAHDHALLIQRALDELLPK